MSIRPLDIQANKDEVVQVYRNLNNGKWSVRSKKTKKVIGHTDALSLLNPVMKVQKGGRARVLKEKRKNVHAFIEGRLRAPLINRDVIKSTFIEISYNPYLKDSFYEVNSMKDVDKGQVCVFYDTKVYML